MIKTLIRKFRGQPSLQEQLNSQQLRDRFAQQGRIIGLYSYGCFDLGRISRGTVIGRYCSFSPTARVQTRNHGIGFLGLTPYFYEPELDVVDRNMVDFNEVVFEDDIWVGANAVILPSAGRIGRGAAIGAGAIVTRPVPPYAVVAGCPARVIRMRFSEEVIEKIEETRWWEMTPEALKDFIRSRPDLAFDPATGFTRNG